MSNDDTKTITVTIALTFDATDLVDEVGHARAKDLLEKHITMYGDSKAPSVRREIEDIVFQSITDVRVKEGNVPVALRAADVV